MEKECMILESAECEPATGCIVLRLRGQKLLRISGSYPALAELNTAVQESYAFAARPPARGPSAPERDGDEPYRGRWRSPAEITPERDDMAKRRRRQPDLALNIIIRHPESETNETHTAVGPVDRDGHAIGFYMMASPGPQLALVQLRRGMSPAVAAAILGKVARRIEDNPWLLVGDEGAAGHFNERGAAETDEG
jgi:hypothetical protein